MKRLLLPLLAALAFPTAVNAETSDGLHKKCLEARDYAGCMQYEGSTNKVPKKVKNNGKINCVQKWCNPGEFVGNDNLGHSVIPGWYFYDDPIKKVAWYLDPKIYKVEVNNNFGRYIHRRIISRFYQEPKAGTQGYTQTFGNSYTNCYGYGISFSCSTSPPITTRIPGTPARPGGVYQYIYDYIFDCEDELYAQYQNKNIIRSKDKNGKNKKWISFDSIPPNYNMQKEAISYCRASTKKYFDLNTLSISKFQKYKNKEIKGKPKIRKSSDTSINVNCNSPVWKNKPRCN